MKMHMDSRARRVLSVVIGLQLLIGGTALGVFGTPDNVSARESSHLKVVIIVGPVSGLTDDYKALAQQAAIAARARTDNVVTLYSPNATWPAVRSALDGASVVVYLGHGNGFPSPYGNTLNGSSQDGLGLNPVAGVDDDAHQYFGESVLARDVKLAKGAVVILGHLCYASGNPEPGGPEPTLAVAEQRVDNYARGWIAAGATAVIAEGHGEPSYYVSGLLKGRGTIEQMWRNAPTFHDHVIASTSGRTPGATLLLDPDRTSRGYFRSLVVGAGTKISQTLSGGSKTGGSRGTTGTPVIVVPTGPLSPAQQGATFGAPVFHGRTVAGTVAALTVAVDARTLGILSRTVSLGTRWDPLDRVAPAQPRQVQAGPSASPAPAASASASADPDAVSVGTKPTTTIPPIDPPSIGLISAETPGAVVAVAPAALTGSGLTIPITMPAKPGLYRLVTTIHDAGGVAYDAATQDLLGALLVRVTGSLSASYGVPADLLATAAGSMAVRVRVANTGTEPWSQPTDLHRVVGLPSTSTAAPHLVARWVRLDDAPGTEPAGVPDAIRVDAAPGTESVLDFTIATPSQAGPYLLMFDLETEDGQSLASLGVAPGMTRVVVGPSLAAPEIGRPADGVSAY